VPSNCPGLASYFINCAGYSGSSEVCCDGRYAEALRSMCAHLQAENGKCVHLNATVVNSTAGASPLQEARLATLKFQLANHIPGSNCWNEQTNAWCGAECATATGCKAAAPSCTFAENHFDHKGNPAWCFYPDTADTGGAGSNCWNKLTNAWCGAECGTPGGCANSAPTCSFAKDHVDHSGNPAWCFYPDTAGTGVPSTNCWNEQTNTWCGAECATEKGCKAAAPSCTFAENHNDTWGNPAWCFVPDVAPAPTTCARQFVAADSTCEGFPVVAGWVGGTCDPTHPVGNCKACLYVGTACNGQQVVGGYIAGGSPAPAPPVPPTTPVCGHPGSPACLPGFTVVGFGFNAVTGELASRAVVDVLGKSTKQQYYTIPGTSTPLLVPDQMQVVDDITSSSSVSSTVYHDAASYGSDIAKGLSLGIDVSTSAGMLSASAGVKTAETALNQRAVYGAFVSSSFSETLYKLSLPPAADLKATPEFQNAAVQLPKAYDDKSYLAFLAIFGTHFVSQARFGGQGNMFTSVRNEFSGSNDDTSVQSNANLQFDFLKAGGSSSTGTSKADADFVTNSNFATSLQGGEPGVYTSLQEWSLWYKSVKDYPAPIFKTVAKVSGLIADATISANIDKAIDAYFARNPYPANPDCERMMLCPDYTAGSGKCCPVDQPICDNSCGCLAPGKQCCGDGSTCPDGQSCSSCGCLNADQQCTDACGIIGSSDTCCTGQGNSGRFCSNQGNCCADGGNGYCCDKGNGCTDWIWPFGYGCGL